jgi:hypothetical protein
MNTSPVADKLPKLNEEDKEKARNAESIAWAYGLMGRYTPGDLHLADDGVLALQKVDINTIRCIRVYDVEKGFWLLAMFRENFKAAGIELQVDPYTLVTPIPDEMVEEQRALEARNAGSEESAPSGAASEAVAAASRVADDYVGMEVV